MTRIVVITAGFSTPSSSQQLGERLASATTAALAGPVEVTHVRVRELASDLAGYMATRIASPALRDALDAVGTASGVIAVTPVLNGSYSGLFKMFLDALDEGAMKGRPVLMAAAGGTARHSLVIDHAMLPLFHYLKAAPATTGVFAATEDWGDAEASLGRRVRAAGEEFAELVVSRPALDYADEFASVPDFEALLRG